MPYLTIFSAPKPFTDPHIATIQRNAIQSWINLGPQVQVFLVGDEAGLAEAAADYDVPVLANVQRTPGGTPLVRSIFDLARQASDSPFLAYINADILLMDDLLQAVQDIMADLEIPPQISNQPRQNQGKQSPISNSFLLIGQRWDLDVTEPMDFSGDWQARLRSEVAARGSLHAPAGSDYFVFPRPAFSNIPDFAIGRAGWDNWMIYHARKQGWPVIDGTPSVMIVHQNHDYSHLPGGIPHYDHPESKQNMALAGGLAHMYMVLDTDRQLANHRLRPAPLTPERLIRAAERTLMPPDGRLRGPRGNLARAFRRLRRKLFKD